MKRKSNNNSISVDDLCYVEEVEENGVCESPILGTPVAMFSFDSTSSPTNEPMFKESASKKEVETKLATDSSIIFSPPTDKTLTNIKASRSQPYGITPPVNGEYFDTRRTFNFRQSTVRMLNELKAANPDINAYLSSIVDQAVCHYHEYIFKEKGSQ